MAEKVKCQDCVELKPWALEQNCCAFCGKMNKTVKKDESCPKGKKR